VDIRQSPLWASYLNDLGWTSEKLSEQQLVYIRKIPPFGSLIKILRISPPVDFQKIDGLAKKHGALFVKLEPELERGGPEKIDGTIQENGFHTDKWSLVPTKTIQIDLQKSEGELLKSLEKDTRYSIRLAQKNGITVKQTDDLPLFQELYRQTGKRQGFWIAEKELQFLWQVFYPQKAATILTAFHNNEPLAAVLLLFYDKTSYYYHAASLHKERKLMAPYLLVWESIRLAKKRGCTLFDFEGIYDPRIPSTKRWQGFSHFKRGFGGKEVTHPGSFIKFYNPILKFIFWVGGLFN
jgi:lipid II:glycine glycyltransferase (peptidoglycan interpeptide bridge formation enzyme)